MARKVEVQVFPETTSPPRYHAYSLWQIAAVGFAVFFAVLGFLVIDPFSIVKKWTDVSLFRMYSQNKDLLKTLNQLQDQSERAKAEIEESRKIREEVTKSAGIPLTEPKVLLDPEPTVENSFGAIGPARNMQRIRFGHASIKRFLDSLKSNASYAKSLPLIHPMKRHAMVTGRFALAYDPHTGSDLPHRGVDYASFEGDTVIAPGGGMVASIVNDKGFGLCMTIVHNERTETFYAHLNMALVGPGQSVSRGQPIALVGKSGRSAGPHLHYELHIMGQPVNPEDYYIAP
jgi:murein DD-endopeptidase MepM/ murein hydrolase activator NlpD